MPYDFSFPQIFHTLLTLTSYCLNLSGSFMFSVDTRFYEIYHSPHVQGHRHCASAMRGQFSPLHSASQCLVALCGKDIRPLHRP